MAVPARLRFDQTGHHVILRPVRRAIDSAESFVREQPHTGQRELLRIVVCDHLEFWIGHVAAVHKRGSADGQFVCAQPLRHSE
ncbi:hypothetical protein D3C75_742140 [compost metagenome]